MIQSEVIVVLNNLRNYYSNRQGGEENAQALDFAISSLLTDEAYQLEYERTTKNDLGVDCISRQVISDYVESHIQEINTGYGDLNRHTNSILRMIVDYIENMPSVTPQEPFKPMVEIDLYSVIKQKYIERKVLDKIREQIKSNLRGVEIALEVLAENHPLRQKMEGAKDTLEDCLELIDKADKEQE